MKRITLKNALLTLLFTCSLFLGYFYFRVYIYNVAFHNGYEQARYDFGIIFTKCGELENELRAEIAKLKNEIKGLKK